MRIRAELFMIKRVRVKIGSVRTSERILFENQNLSFCLNLKWTLYGLQLTAKCDKKRVQKVVCVWGGGGGGREGGRG